MLEQEFLIITGILISFMMKTLSTIPFISMIIEKSYAKHCITGSCDDITGSCTDVASQRTLRP